MKKVTIKRENTGKTPSLWPITANCTKFIYILLEWHGLLLGESKPSIKWVLVFIVLQLGFDLCWFRSRSSPALRASALSSADLSVSVSVCVRAGWRLVDPVQDDEAHAAEHDQEAAQQEGGGLEGGFILVRTHTNRPGHAYGGLSL